MIRPPKKLVIFGAGGHAGKIVEIARAQSLEILGFVSIESPGTRAHGFEVLGDVSWFNHSPDTKETPIHIAIGENSVRRQIMRKIQPDRRKLLKQIVSPAAVISENATIGSGSAIMSGAVVWSNVTIGVSCIVDSGAIVEHDTDIGDFVNISPGSVLCGGISVGNGAIIGAGAVVIEKVRIGENALIGAGSLIRKDVQPNVVVSGNPARLVRKRDANERYLR